MRGIKTILHFKSIITNNIVFELENRIYTLSKTKLPENERFRPDSLYLKEHRKSHGFDR